ncbi:Type 1 glutamine amidotransferase-like domain-containing protein [Planomicrobium sp. CPCC 101079]|uniref:Type 1 glutamine amidotransferase-like domain-containing protein n=1 Tax=Planomicrobium sp. CPCC 101079 TaxID=2599618 RepID=UPI0011B7A73D|nr:Type 1 glutamine amidotransferase-like domain-containing protein [Planomicrobium sp. CPCC 101079]TWT04693.1 hypothetical protein FQV28_08815 [Planomicrobium sp. CPCC 101079]
MGKLFFYSDQTLELSDNERLDRILLDGRDSINTTIGYIPSTEDREKTHFNTKVHYYRNYGIKELMFFDLYSEFDSSKIGELLKCDIIHLSAGNPVEFRNAIKHRGMDKILSNYFNGGGTIVGVSGRAVQFGMSINLFQLFTGDLVQGLEALQFVDFEFCLTLTVGMMNIKKKFIHMLKQTE